MSKRLQAQQKSRTSFPTSRVQDCLAPTPRRALTLSRRHSPSTEAASSLPFVQYTDVVKRYALGDKLGEGGYAKVYAAKDLQRNMPVAIKVTNSNLSASTEKEIQLLVRHAGGPNLVAVHEAFYVRGHVNFDNSLWVRACTALAV